MKVSAISAVYFQQFDELIRELEVAAVIYLNYLLVNNFDKEYRYLKDEKQGRMVYETRMRLEAKRSALTRSLKNFAREHFQ